MSVKSIKPPLVKFPNLNVHYAEAMTYVENNFSSNYGEISKSFIYPTTFIESRAWLKQFLQHRFSEFGEYEDALVNGESILHHSVLTPMLNVGLLTPIEILDRAIAFASENKIPLNSCEGFIRQILGWREFIRGVYEAKARKSGIRTTGNLSEKYPNLFGMAQQAFLLLTRPLKRY